MFSCLSELLNELCRFLGFLLSLCVFVVWFMSVNFEVMIMLV